MVPPSSMEALLLALQATSKGDVVPGHRWQPSIDGTTSVRGGRMRGGVQVQLAPGTNRHRVAFKPKRHTGGDELPVSPPPRRAGGHAYQSEELPLGTGKHPFTAFGIDTIGTVIDSSMDTAKRGMGDGGGGKGARTLHRNRFKGTNASRTLISVGGESVKLPVQKAPSAPPAAKGVLCSVVCCLLTPACVCGAPGIHVYVRWCADALTGTVGSAVINGLLADTTRCAVCCPAVD